MLSSFRDSRKRNIKKAMKEGVEVALCFQAHISTAEFPELLENTEPEWSREPPEGLLLRPLDVHEVCYVRK